MYLASRSIERASTDRSDHSGSNGSAATLVEGARSANTRRDSLAIGRDCLSTGRDYFANGRDQCRGCYESYKTFHDP